MDELIDQTHELFDYNRENFMFDREMRLKREYQEQNMRIKQFCLYREDVRDLTELTTGKMDSYLLIALLELGCCIDLLVHGVMEGTRDVEVPLWLLWLYVISLAEAFLYLFLSCWFAIHASVACHSFAVRLLTQFVRLPVPDRQKLDAARTYAAEYEGDITEMIRVPVWKQQAEKVAEARKAAEDEADQAGQDGIDDDGTRVAAAGGIAAFNETNPASGLRHVRLYRDLQSNWQAHDAYARACLALGTYTMLHAVAYYCIGLLVIELRSPWAALATSLVLPMLAWLLIRLDLYFGSYIFVIGTLLLMMGPVLALICVTALVSSATNSVETEETIHVFIVPLIFILHIALIVAIVLAARADQRGDRRVALPTRFRTVLYLDVFGWLGDTEEEHEHGETGAEAAAEPPSRVLPAQVRDALREECRTLLAIVRLEVIAWEGDVVKESLGTKPELAQQVVQLRQHFDQAEQAHAVLLNGPSGARGSNDDDGVAGRLAAMQNLWLRISIAHAEFFVCARTGKAVVRDGWPEGAFVSDIEEVQERLAMAAQRCEMLEEAVRAEEVAAAAAGSRWTRIRRRITGSHRDATNGIGDSASGSSSSVPIDSQGPAQVTSPSSSIGSPNLSPVAAHGRPSRQGISSKGTSKEASAVVSENVGGDDAQEVRFGGREAAQGVGEGAGWGHSPATAQTFHPRQDGRSESRRPPGQMPWVTFLAASVAVGSVWLSGVGDYVIVPLINEEETKPEHESGPEMAAFLGLQAKAVSLPPLVGAHRLAIAVGERRLSSVRATGLACNDAHGPSLLIAEQYAVHELMLNVSTWGGAFQGADATVNAKRMDSIEHCLDQAPEFHSGGIAGVSLECSPPRKCAAVLLSASGHGALHCTLPSTDAEEPRATVVSFAHDEGGGWGALATFGKSSDSGPREWWALSMLNEDLLPTKLRVRTSRSGKVRAVAAAPSSAVSAQTRRSSSSDRTVSLSSWGQGALIGLSPNGRFVQAWATPPTPAAGQHEHDRMEQSEGQVVAAGSWQLPAGRRWGGVCVTDGFVFAVGEEETSSFSGDAALELWRFDLPAALEQLGGKSI